RLLGARAYSASAPHAPASPSCRETRSAYGATAAYVLPGRVTASRLRVVGQLLTSLCPYSTTIWLCAVLSDRLSRGRRASYSASIPHSSRGVDACDRWSRGRRTERLTQTRRRKRGETHPRPARVD